MRSNWNRRQLLIATVIVAAAIGYAFTTWAAAANIGRYIQGGCVNYSSMSVLSSLVCFFFWPTIELDRLGGMSVFQWLGGSALVYELICFSAVSYVLWHQLLKLVAKQRPGTPPVRPHAE